MKYNDKKIGYKINDTNNFHQSSSLLALSSPSFYSSSISSPLINDVFDYAYKKENGSSGFTLNIDKIQDNYGTSISTNFPLCFNHRNIIKIPTKVAYNLNRYTPDNLLNAIHPNKDVAIELCLLFIKNLTSTHFDLLEDSSSEGWKSLKSSYLRDYFSTSSLTYKNIRIALEAPLKGGPILECDYLSAKNIKCFQYRLGEAYREKGIVSYELKTSNAIKLLDKRNKSLFEKAMKNIICKNLLQFYSEISFPTIDEIIAEAKRLIKLGYKTKKGKRLTFLNKHRKSYFNNPENYSFVEDHIKRFQYLTENGLMIPRPGSEASGGRVIDSINLMPGWIRSMIKIGGVRLEECDYICLHPNIANAHYGGNQEWLSHPEVALRYGLKDEIVKTEHLSFFNKSAYNMAKSLLFEGYKKNEPRMMKNIINEKYQSPYGHKATSRTLFSIEVRIMTDVIFSLNQEGIYPGYVFDALICHPKHTERVKEIMNSTILKYGVKTQAKSSKDKNLYQPFGKSDGNIAAA